MRFSGDDMNVSVPPMSQSPRETGALFFMIGLGEVHIRKQGLYLVKGEPTDAERPMRTQCTRPAHSAFTSRGFQPVERLFIVGKREVPYVGRRKVLAKRFRYAGEMTVRYDCYAFYFLVVFADKMNVRGKSAEALPAGESLRVN